ncbi:MAG: VOC family protein [Burkholderiales bacterium]|nr:VOC family protein [Burkholderiales bacterium]
MLADAPMTTILPVTDMQRARSFYERQLGLKPAGARADGKFTYECGGGALLALFPRSEATRADHTAVSFRVADIGSAIAQLEGRGVVFEDYDLPGLKTVEHVCVLGAEKAAWFRDTEGNILCIHEDIADAR